MKPFSNFTAPGIDVSILLPAIRPERWENFYTSAIDALGKYSCELILVSPKPLPAELEKIPVKYIRDYGSPTRCFNIALQNAEGKYCTWAADDGKYVPNGLEKVIDKYKQKLDENCVVAMAQVEAGNHYNKDFVRIKKHPQLRHQLIGEDWIFFPTAIMNTSLLKAFGGLDCIFNGHAMAHIDLACRMQASRVSCLFDEEIALHLDHMMGPSGDHGPIHHSQLQVDEPLLEKLYGKELRRVQDNKFIASTFLNWDDVENIWPWRFHIVNNKVEIK